MFFSESHTPEVKMDRLVQGLKLFLNSCTEKLENCECDCDLPDFSTFPKFFRTIMSHFKSWNVGHEYDEYCVCSRHHLKLRSELETPDGVIAACPAKLPDGSDCSEPLFKEAKTKLGGTKLVPIKSFLYRGFRRPLETLFRQYGGYDPNQWKDLPDVSPTVCDFYTSRLWKASTPFFNKLDGKNVMLWLSVDW